MWGNERWARDGVVCVRSYDNEVALPIYVKRGKGGSLYHRGRGETIH